MKGILGTLREFTQLLWKERMWWMIPMVVVLVGLMGLIVLGSSSGLGPFIYTLF